MTTQDATATQAVTVWDLPTRLFHWSLVALIGFQWLSAEMAWMQWHVWAGYAVLTLVLFRLLWGFIGSRTALFADFVRGPAAAIAYLKAARTGTPQHYVGHNPAGGLMVLALLAFVTFQGITGLFSTDDIFTEGPLYSLVSADTGSLLTTVHKLAFNLLLALIALHIAAALFYLLIKKENLIRPMVLGKKALPAEQVPAARPLAPLWRAAVAFAVAAGVVAFVVNR